MPVISLKYGIINRTHGNAPGVGTAIFARARPDGNSPRPTARAAGHSFCRAVRRPPAPPCRFTQPPLSAPRCGWLMPTTSSSTVTITAASPANPRIIFSRGHPAREAHGEGSKASHTAAHVIRMRRAHPSSFDGAARSPCDRHGTKSSFHRPDRPATPPPASPYKAATPVSSREGEGNRGGEGSLAPPHGAPPPSPSDGAAAPGPPPSRGMSQPRSVTFRARGRAAATRRPPRRPLRQRETPTARPAAAVAPAARASAASPWRWRRAWLGHTRRAAKTRRSSRSASRGPPPGRRARRGLSRRPTRRRGSSRHQAATRRR